MKETQANALITVGVILLTMCFLASAPVDSEFSPAVASTRVGMSPWLLLAGTLVAVIGAIGLVRHRI